MYTCMHEVYVLYHLTHTFLRKDVCIFMYMYICKICAYAPGFWAQPAPPPNGCALPPLRGLWGLDVGRSC